MHSLNILSDTMGTSITKIMEPHKEVLQDMIPPKKHLLRYQPANAQIGLMEGNTFCTTLDPRLFTIDLNTVEHKVFFTEVSLDICIVYIREFIIFVVIIHIYIAYLNLCFYLQLSSLCEAEDAVLLKLPCYKSVSNLVPLRKSAMSKFIIYCMVCTSKCVAM